MSSATATASPQAAIERRSAAARRFFEDQAERLARLCRLMADRFAAGGRLLALGGSPAARSDVRHVTVEFVHPVIVGKRALPALGLTGEGGALRDQVALLAEPCDIAIAFGVEDGAQRAGSEVGAALRGAREAGCLTVAFERDVGAEWELATDAEDPFVHQELVETAYHVLWELVHVFFERGGEGRESHGAGAAGFLYPFLEGADRDLEPLVEDVRRSVLAKAEEVDELRRQTLEEGWEALCAAAAALRGGLERGGRLLAIGNGGSATDAMDAVADFRHPPRLAGARRWPARAAIDLTEDPAVITAIANDIGAEAVFLRQVIAHGRDADTLLALSTSGDSRNLIEALAEARRRAIATIAMVGYDGGRIAREGLADHVVVSRSQHIPRIQEAQASASHVLRELVERPGAA